MSYILDNLINFNKDLVQINNEFRNVVQNCSYFERTDFIFVLSAITELLNTFPYSFVRYQLALRVHEL